MKKLLTSIAVLFVFVSAKTFACEKPAPPGLPDAGTAVLAQMTKAQNEVKTYMAAAEAYLTCLGGGDVNNHNAAIKEMEQLADTFNALIREFKARMKR